MTEEIIKSYEERSSKIDTGSRNSKLKRMHSTIGRSFKGSPSKTHDMGAESPERMSKTLRAKTMNLNADFWDVAADPAQCDASPDMTNVLEDHEEFDFE